MLKKIGNVAKAIGLMVCMMVGAVLAGIVSTIAYVVAWGTAVYGCVLYGDMTEDDWTCDFLEATCDLDAAICRSTGDGFGMYSDILKRQKKWRKGTEESEA